MEIDAMLEQALGWLQRGWQLAQGWLRGPAAWPPFGLLILACLGAVLIPRRLSPLIGPLLTSGRFPGRFMLIPVAAPCAMGLPDNFAAFLTDTVIRPLNIGFSAMTLVRGLIAGGLLFWLGMWSNDHSARWIGRQPMRPAIRHVSMTLAEIAIFGIAFLLLVHIMGMSLTLLAVLGGAVGVGIGFGLQKIAGNFGSGLIPMIEGRATVGDCIAPNGGAAGKIVGMTARATILETCDGK